ncbi:MAG: metallopeptidase TldD-related protein [Bacteroidota bacterium]
MQRRTFLKTSAALGAASMLPWQRRAEAAMPPVDPPTEDWMQSAVSEAKALGAVHAELLFISERHQRAQVRKDTLHSITDSEDAGITLRVRFAEGFGSASVSAVRRGSPSELAQMAVESAKIARPPLKNSVRKNSKAKDSDVEDIPRDSGGNDSADSPSNGNTQRQVWSPEGIQDPFLTNLDERIAFLMDLNKTATKVPQIPYAVANQFMQRRSSIFVDSLGSKIEQQQYATYVNFAVTAFQQKQRRMDTRTSDREAQATDWTGATANMQSELETAMQEVLQAQQADSVTPDKYDLVIHPTMLWNLFLETLLPHLDPRQLLERDGRAPGDRWLTLAKLNQRPLRSEALRLRWDNTLPRGLATSGWDDAGRKTGSSVLLGKGGAVQSIPVSPDLIAADSAFGAGFPGTNFSRAAAWYRPATVAMPNMVLEGGVGKNIDDLFGGVDNGLFLKGRGTVMTNPAKTLFRVRPQAAWAIRGGKLAEMLRDVEIETSAEQFWNALEEAGRSEDTFLGGDLFPQRAFPLWDTPFSVATPPALFRGIPVFRTEAQS